MVKYDTNFTASIYYILFGKWMKKKKKIAENFIDLMKKNYIIKCKYEITYV